jgi:ribosome biogenesis GTPase
LNADEKTPDKSKQVQQHDERIAKEETTRRGRTRRRDLRRNIKSKAPRIRDWGTGADDDWEETQYSERDRIMPEDERDRRRGIERESLGADGAIEGQAALHDETNIGTKGIVMSVTTAMCNVEIGDRILRCRLRGRISGLETGFTNGVAVGDEVLVSGTDRSEGLVEGVLPRRTMLTRPDTFNFNRRQLMVANADQLLIVASWREPIIWPELIDRCIIAADIGELEPVICVNKADLMEDDQEFLDLTKVYAELGHTVIKASAVTGEGVAELADLLRGRLTALTGLSGSGKSSLLSQIQPSLDLRTGEISEWSGEGRHTTTQYTLHRLDIGGSVVDTPGIREFGLSGLRQFDLAGWFPDMVEFASNCRFSNCTHLVEPGCAIMFGVDEGFITASRYHSYEMIYDSLPE